MTLAPEEVNNNLPPFLKTLFPQAYLQNDVKTLPSLSQLPIELLLIIIQNLVYTVTQTQINVPECGTRTYENQKTLIGYWTPEGEFIGRVTKGTGTDFWGLWDGKTWYGRGLWVYESGESFQGIWWG